MADQSPTNFANPAPLGLLAFGMTTVLLSLHNLGMYGLDSPVLSMGIFYGGIAQVIAGIVEFRNGNTFGATAFTSYGLFWLSFVAINTGMIPGAAADGMSLGMYFAIWGVLTAFLFIGTLKGNRCTQTVFLTLTVLFFIVAAKDMSGVHELAYAAGAVGVLCGGSAMYTAFAEVVNGQLGRTVMPLGDKTRIR
jgi:uncharacterized protein